MEHLARALVNTAAFLELSGDEVIDPDSAVKAMEDIAAELQKASEQEIEAVARACEAERAQRLRTPGYEASAEFFATFLENFGLAKG